MLLLPGFCFSQEITIKSKIKYQTLFKSDKKTNSCYRIPAIITAPNGDLIALADQRVNSCGDLKSNSDINIVMRRSTDNGKNWSEIEAIVDYPKGQSASDPSMIVDKQTGNIIMFFNYMDLTNEKGIFYLKYTISSDNGKTWTSPVDITSQITKSDWHNDFKFITSGGGTQTKDGKLLHTIVNLEKGLFVFFSSDHATTWHLIDNPILPADESKIIELEDKTWIINSRVNGMGYRYTHFSTDNGQNWTSKAEKSLVDPGCNADFIKYNITKREKSKEAMLFLNANSSSKRENLCLKISYDNGITWKILKEVYPNKAAYSSMTILKNGDIGIIFEKDNYQEIAFVRLKVRKNIK